MTPPSLQEAARKACWECGHSESETACEACVASGIERAVAEERPRAQRDLIEKLRKRLNGLTSWGQEHKLLTELLLAEAGRDMSGEEFIAAIRRGPTKPEKRCGCGHRESDHRDRSCHADDCDCTGPTE